MHPAPGFPPPGGWGMQLGRLSAGLAAAGAAGRPAQGPAHSCSRCRPPCSSGSQFGRQRPRRQRSGCHRRTAATPSVGGTGAGSRPRLRSRRRPRPRRRSRRLGRFACSTPQCRPTRPMVCHHFQPACTVTQLQGTITTAGCCRRSSAALLNLGVRAEASAAERRRRLQLRPWRPGRRQIQCILECQRTKMQTLLRTSRHSSRRTSWQLTRADALKTWLLLVAERIAVMPVHMACP